MQAIIALGSSVPPPGVRLRQAIEALSAHSALTLLSQSEIVFTAAAGGGTLQRFANAAVVLETALGPVALLQLLHALEADAGRLRTRPLGPRTLDLDLLEVPAWPTMEGAGFSLPHPGREQPYARAFVSQALSRLSSMNGL